MHVKKELLYNCFSCKIRNFIVFFIFFLFLFCLFYFVFFILFFYFVFFILSFSYNIFLRRLFIFFKRKVCKLIIYTCNMLGVHSIRAVPPSFNVNILLICTITMPIKRSLWTVPITICVGPVALYWICFRSEIF